MATTATKVKTPAEIPAESRVAQRSDYAAALPIEYIAVHPRNIRHNAVADTELVDSIREQGLLQPLVVTGKADSTAGTTYLLIAGHRRLDALKRAGFTHASVVIRHDLTDEADQVAAMLVENGRRADLTPVEEAEGFDLLSELGWSVDQIAAASGRSKTTVTERRKLTRLPEKTKTAVDAAQVTIDDALRLAKLPPADQARIDRYVGMADFKLELSSTENRIQAEAALKAEVKRLRDAGVPELEQPHDANYRHTLTHSLHGMVQLSVTGKPNASDHDGCLAFVIARPTDVNRGFKTVWEVCTDPGKHDEQLAVQHAERKAAIAAENAEREARMEAYRIQREEERQSAKVARQLRVDDLLAGLRLKPTQLDPLLVELVRVVLPDVMFQNPPADWGELRDLAGCADDKADLSELAGIQVFLKHKSAPAVVKLLAVYLATWTEGMLDVAARGMADTEDVTIAAGYFAVLDQAGHERNSADTTLLERINPMPAGEEA